VSPAAAPVIAYLILAHRNPEQVRRLIARLAGERARFLVHFDARTDLSAHEAQLRSLPDVRLADDRHKSDWGSFALVRATLDLMEAALAIHPEVRRLTLLSGQDYPIKPRRQIESFLLEEHPDRSFVEHFRLPRPDWGPDGGMSRIEDRHVLIAGRVRSLRNSRLGIRRSLPGGLTPFQGGQYWSLTRDCAELVLRYGEHHPEVVRFFRRTAMPDELFFQTIVMSSPLAAMAENSDLRYERWDEGGSHPAVLTAEDLPALRASQALFAKKFDTAVDPDVLDRIDRELLGSTPPGG
jgi:hypothetical protein